MRIRPAFFALLCSLSFPAVALAEGVSGADWDHRHMRARHPGQASAARQAPIQIGINGYDHVQSGDALEVTREIPETLDSATQRSWGGGRVPVKFGENVFRRDPGVGVEAQSSPRRSGTGGSSLRSGVRSTPTR